MNSDFNLKTPPENHPTGHQQTVLDDASLFLKCPKVKGNRHLGLSSSLRTDLLSFFSLLRGCPCCFVSFQGLDSFSPASSFFARRRLDSLLPTSPPPRRRVVKNGPVARTHNRTRLKGLPLLYGRFFLPSLPPGGTVWSGATPPHAWNAPLPFWVEALPTSHQHSGMPS